MSVSFGESWRSEINFQRLLRFLLLALAYPEMLAAYPQHTWRAHARGNVVASGGRCRRWQSFPIRGYAWLFPASVRVAPPRYCQVNVKHALYEAEYLFSTTGNQWLRTTASFYYTLRSVNLTIPPNAL